MVKTPLPMTAPLSAVAVANELAALALAARVTDLSPSKLHDLVYLAHGWSLGVAGKALIAGAIHAWRDGVFAPELREAGCWGTKRLDGWVTTLVTDAARGVMVEQTPRLPPKDPAHKTLAAAWKLYGGLSPFDLSRITKEAGAPWDLIWNDEQRPDDEPKPIPNATLRLWFRELAAKRRGKAQLGLTDTRRFHASVGLEATQQMLEQPDPERVRAV